MEIPESSLNNPVENPIKEKIKTLIQKNKGYWKRKRSRNYCK